MSDLPRALQIVTDYEDHINLSHIKGGYEAESTRIEEVEDKFDEQEIIDALEQFEVVQNRVIDGLEHGGHRGFITVKVLDSGECYGRKYEDHWNIEEMNWIGDWIPVKATPVEIYVPTDESIILDAERPNTGI